MQVDSDGEEERDLSPPLEPLPEGATAEDAVDPAEDLAALEEQRRRVLQASLRSISSALRSAERTRFVQDSARSCKIVLDSARR